MKPRCRTCAPSPTKFISLLMFLQYSGRESSQCAARDIKLVNARARLNLGIMHAQRETGIIEDAVYMYRVFDDC